MKMTLRRGFGEATPAVSTPTALTASRRGWVTGVPLGGTNENNPGQNITGGSLNRETYMQQLYQGYIACPWANACVDVIARTCTAGGIEPVPNSLPTDTAKESHPTPPPGVQRVQRLLNFVNPENDIRQLMRGVISDLLIFGDSFTEVVWAMGEPIALYPLDSSTMTVLSDEHGSVRGYSQRTQSGRTAKFARHEVIHVALDSPATGLYGISPMQKAMLPITVWLFAEALLKETFKKGDPLRAHVDWPISLSDPELKRWNEQYPVRNLGAKNIGALLQTRGGATVRELGVNQIDKWNITLDLRRNEIISVFGCPPAKVGIIESGNIGGGTGTSQDKIFRVNTCGPIEELVMEKFSFHLLWDAFDIQDWHLQFGDVDWRDDIVVENIRDQRIRSGQWTLNRARADIGEPAVEGGDVPILVDRQNLVLWPDMADASKSRIIKDSGGLLPEGTSEGFLLSQQAAATQAKQQAALNPGSQDTSSDQEDEPAKKPASESGIEDHMVSLVEAWRTGWKDRYKRAESDLPVSDGVQRRLQAETDRADRAEKRLRELERGK